MRELSYFYDWDLIPAGLHSRVIREFLDHGVHTFVYTDDLIRLVMSDAGFEKTFNQTVKDMGICFSGMHAPYGSQEDLNTPDPERRPAMLAMHKKAIRIAAENRIRTYTIHVGAHHYCHENHPIEPLRKLAKQSLEELIPEAEKCGVIIAVENSFEPPNSAAEVLDLITPFLSSPAIGVCYDSGHANCMQPRKWKRMSGYHPGFLEHWREGFVYEDDALGKLAPHIVCCHLHDNTGYADLHAMPGDGTVIWPEILPALLACPRLIEPQTEVCTAYGKNWAGELMAPVGGYSVKRLVETFRSLGFK